MSLNFPNPSRSFDPDWRRIRFWGHDSAMEVRFFLEADAIFVLYPETKDTETGILAAVRRGTRAHLRRCRQGLRVGPPSKLLHADRRPLLTRRRRMTARVTVKSVCFTQPFRLGGITDVQAPGTYPVTTKEEQTASDRTARRLAMHFDDHLDCP